MLLLPIPWPFASWTAAEDGRLRRLRAEGGTWVEIAHALGRTPDGVMARGLAIGARRPPADFSPPPEDPEREPLPAGHPRSWGALTADTLLDGTDYPLPFFFT